MRKVLAYLSASLLLTWTVFFPGTSPAELVSKYRCNIVARDYAWTKEMSQAYARIVAKDKYNWGQAEYLALVKLWEKESHWNPKAYNSSVERNSGQNAGGIPQLLGLKPTTPAPVQIDRGLAYISTRYGKPSSAWKHHQLHGWY